MMTFVFCLTLCVAAPALAQKVPLPPKPADDGPSLAETMKYIQDRLNEQGEVRWQTLGAMDKYLNDHPITPEDWVGKPWSSITASNAICESRQLYLFVEFG
jgi:hypothetical protein